MKKAYDSVSWFGLLKALKRIKMNENYINLLRDLYTTRWSFIITDYGPTEPHHIEAELDQGEIHTLILWRIFYDPLLCKINNTKSQTDYNINTITRHSTNINAGATTTSNHINYLAFVDDTI